MVCQLERGFELGPAQVRVLCARKEGKVDLGAGVGPKAAECLERKAVGHGCAFRVLCILGSPVEVKLKELPWLARPAHDGLELGHLVAEEVVSPHVVPVARVQLLELFVVELLYLGEVFLPRPLQLLHVLPQLRCHEAVLVAQPGIQLLGHILDALGQDLRLCPLLQVVLLQLLHAHFEALDRLDGEGLHHLGIDAVQLPMQELKGLLVVAVPRNPELAALEDAAGAAVAQGELLEEE